MHKYVLYSCRTLFAGLLLMGVTCCNETTSESYIITSNKYEALGTDIVAQPSVYSLNSLHFMLIGAAKEGCKTAALTKLTFASSHVAAIAHKRVIMNNAKDQPSPLYDQKMLHVCASPLAGLYAVTASQPDTIYRYTQFDTKQNATVHECKVSMPDGRPCTIVRLAVSDTGANEFVVAELAPLTGVGEHAIASVFSVTKQVPQPKKSPEMLAAEERIYAQAYKDKSQDEIDELKKEREEESKKTIAKYMFVQFDLVKNEEGAQSNYIGDFLPQELRSQGRWQISDMCFFSGSLMIELRLHGSDFYRLVGYETENGKGVLKPLPLCQGYYRAQRKAPMLAWEQAPGMCLSPFNRKKQYCIVVGDLTASKDSCKSLIAFSGSKKEQLTPMKIGGNAILPGPICHIKSENETVYVAVAQSDTNAQPGVFYSQAILDGSGAIAAWSSWRRTAGSSEPVVGILPNDSGLRILQANPFDSTTLRLHTLRWRGDSVRMIEDATEKAVAAEVAKQEMLKKELEQRRQDLEAQKKAQEKINGKEDAQPEVASAPIEAPEAPCVNNTGFEYGKGLKSTYHSSQLLLCDLFKKAFEPHLGGVRAIIDVPAFSESAATFVIAVGHNQVMLAQTNQLRDKEGKLIIRAYDAAVHKNGALHAQYISEDTVLDAVQCTGGALEELGFIDAVHVASNGTDAWVVVAGPLGVAVLSAHNGAGVNARAGFGDRFKAITESLSFKMVGNYQWVRAISSDNQFLYITTEDTIDRIPLKRACFSQNPVHESCCIATGDDIGKVCDGYVFNDVCISHGMIIAATPGGLVATAPGVDCREVTDAEHMVWQKVPMPAACTTVEHLVPVSTTGNAQDVACKGQLYVIACSLFDETASITRLFIDKDADNRIQLVPDVKTKYSGSWLNYVHRISAFMTDGSIHLVGRTRFETKTVDLAKVTAGTKRNSGSSQFVFDEGTHQINTIIRSSGSGSVFVAADDGVRVYE